MARRAEQPAGDQEAVRVQVGAGVPDPVAGGEEGGGPTGALGGEGVQAAEAVEEEGGQGGAEDGGETQEPLLIGEEGVGQAQDAEGKEGVGGVEVLAPVPVSRFVLAQFDPGDEPEFEQAAQEEEAGPEQASRIDGVQGAVYILNLVVCDFHTRSFRRIEQCRNANRKKV